MSAAGETATRRRGRALESAIFAATLEELAAVGYAKVTMEGVAEAAGTGKAALYRRWPSKEDLVFAALADSAPRPMEIPHQATVRDDLIALLDCYKQLHTAAHGAAFRALKEASKEQYGRLHELLRSTVTGPIKELLLAALERGVERGEVRPAAATARVASLGPAMVSYYCLTEQPVVPEGYTESVVDDIIMPLISPAGAGGPGGPAGGVSQAGVTASGGGSPRPGTAAAAS